MQEVNIKPNTHRLGKIFEILYMIRDLYPEYKDLLIVKKTIKF